MRARPPSFIKQTQFPARDEAPRPAMRMRFHTRRAAAAARRRTALVLLLTAMLPAALLIFAGLLANVRRAAHAP
jgi:hypothetical protein